MKKVLFMLLVASLAFVSCQKSSIQDLDQQRGKKAREQALMVAVTSAVLVDWTPEDNVISIDSAKSATENVGQGFDVFWSVRADETMLPQINIHISVWNEPTDSTIGYWSAIGNQDAYINAPGGAGKIFSGINESRVYRAAFMDKKYIWHYSSPYQIN